MRYRHLAISLAHAEFAGKLELETDQATTVAAAAIDGVHVIELLFAHAPTSRSVTVMAPPALTA
jgi:hypothetical protein